MCRWGLHTTAFCLLLLLPNTSEDNGSIESEFGLTHLTMMEGKVVGVRPAIEGFA